MEPIDKSHLSQGVIPSLSSVGTAVLDSNLGVIVVKKIDVSGDLVIPEGTQFYVLGSVNVSGCLTTSEEMTVKGDICAGEIRVGAAKSEGSLIGNNAIDSNGDIRADGSILCEFGTIRSGGSIRCEGSIMARGNIQASGDIVARRSIVSIDGSITSSMGSIISLTSEIASELGTTASASVHAGTSIIGPCSSGVRIATGLATDREVENDEATIDESTARGPWLLRGSRLPESGEENNEDRGQRI